jgi:hypothetical protein
MKRPLLDGGLVICARCTLRAASHFITELVGKTSRYRILCCQCYIAEGNAPATWHPDCQRAFAAKKGNGRV